MINANIHNVLRKAREYFSGWPGVQGVGYGLKEVNSNRTVIPSLRIYVECKKAIADIPVHLLLPAKFKGLQTDVIHLPSGTRPCTATFPAPMMLANAKGVPGTLGCFVRRRPTNETVLLSNYHVLYGKKSQRGDRIWEVTKTAGGHDFAPVGTNLVGKAGHVKYKGQQYFVDAAIGRLDVDWCAFNKELIDTHHYPTATAVEPGECVHKTGATTGKTKGIVVDVCYPDNWYSDRKSIKANNQLLIEPIDEKLGPFSQPGDSGAAIVTDEGSLAGLLWGHNGRGEGVACPIQPILKDLKLELDLLPTQSDD